VKKLDMLQSMKQKLLSRFQDSEALIENAKANGSSASDVKALQMLQLKYSQLEKRYETEVAYKN
jgi:hypothetical protein